MRENPVPRTPLVGEAARCCNPCSWPLCSLHATRCRTGFWRRMLCIAQTDLAINIRFVRVIPGRLFAYLQQPQHTRRRDADVCISAMDANDGNCDRPSYGTSYRSPPSPLPSKITTQSRKSFHLLQFYVTFRTLP